MITGPECSYFQLRRSATSKRHNGQTNAPSPSRWARGFMIIDGDPSAVPSTGHCSSVVSGPHRTSMKRQTVLAACKRIPQAKFTNNRVVPLVCKHSAVGLIEVCKVKPEDPVDYIGTSPSTSSRTTRRRRRALRERAARLGVPSHGGRLRWQWQAVGCEWWKARGARCACTRRLALQQTVDGACGIPCRSSARAWRLR